MTRLIIHILLIQVTSLALVRAADPDSGSTSATGFFKRYCNRCHGTHAPKAGIEISNLIEQRAEERDLAQWESIIEMLDANSMPPADERQPPATERRDVIRWMESELRRSIPTTRAHKSPAVTRRLTNFEYENTLRDLLGIELKLARYLPQDPSAPYQFDNSGDQLLMGAEQLERYAENAVRAMAAVIVDPKPPHVVRVRKDWESKDAKNELAIEGNKRGSPASGVSIKSWPEHGDYRVRVKASGVFPGGTDRFPLRLVMGYSLASDIGAAPFEPIGTIQLTKDNDTPEVYEFRGRIENHPSEPERQYRRGGTRTGNLVTIPASMVITPQNLFDDGTLNDKLDTLLRPRAVIDWIEFEAPYFESWPPLYHRRILFESPLIDTDRRAYVRLVLQRFLSRAFRGPVQAEDVDRYLRIYDIYATPNATFEQAMRDTLAVALSSPRFLYHTSTAEDTDPDYWIANRLSYFLWGSMPDEELFRLADAGQLTAPQVVAAQAERLLSDKRSLDFIRHFSTQWLSLERCKSVPMNEKMFPRFLHRVARGQHAGEEVPFRPTIRDDMVDETIQFVATLIDENLSLLNIVNSDFAILNERLANHYHIPGVKGAQLRRVNLPRESRLGGVLTQGSILVGTGTGSAPHPIYRAVWLREAILGDEVKPPPADVPALEESAGKAAQTSADIQALLRKHRQKASCNDCHARLDPWGLPFEHYNAAGRFQPMVPKPGTRVRGFDLKRDTDLAGYNAYLKGICTEHVAAASTLPDGRTIDGLDALKAYLIADRADDVAENVVRRLLTYALGRRLTYRDRFVIERLVDESRANEHRLRDLIISICQSELFLDLE